MAKADQNRIRLDVAFLLTSLIIVSIASPIQAQISPMVAPPNPRANAKLPFRENATLPADGNLRKRLIAVNALLVDQHWNEAIETLQEISQTESRSLVVVQQGTSGGVSSYLNAATYCNVLLSRVPAEGRRSYRLKIDSQAKRWYENWLRTRDEAELLRIVQRAFLSSYGDDALMALGEAAWDQGDFSTARLWWERLVPLPTDVDPADYPTVLRYPDASEAQSTILARIVMCSILEGERIRATEELRQFAERYPLAEGRLAGQNGLLSELLQRILDESREWKPTTSAAEVATYGTSSSRFQNIPQSVDIGAIRWTQPLSPNLLIRPKDVFPVQDEPLSYFPVVYGKVVLVNDADSIRAWNILTGEPAWQSDRTDAAVIYPSVPDESSPVPDKSCVGVPYYTMTIADDHLFARMGYPVTCPSSQQRDLVSELVCLDLTQEGKLEWKLSTRELFHDNSWRFEGTPVVVAGRAYLAVSRRQPQLELMVACLDSTNGQLIWKQPIGGFRSSVDERFNRVSHLLLTAGEGRLFISSDAGAIIALDAQDGRLEWAVSYESRNEANRSEIALSDPSRNGLLPPLFHNGMLFVAPNDADSAFCFDADSGRLRWRYSYLTNLPQNLPTGDRREREAEQLRERKWRYLLGVVPGGALGRLIVGGDRLSSIDIATGHEIWHRSRSSFGRGALAGNEILIPERESIHVFNQQTGDPVRVVPLKTPDSAQRGGNLTVASGMLLISQPNRLAAFCEFSRLKERLDRDLTLQPDSAESMMHVAELRAAEGEFEVADLMFRQAIERVDKDDPLSRMLRYNLMKHWQNAGDSAFRGSHFELALESWQQALPFADRISQRIELIFNLIRVDELLDRPKSAVMRLQTILADDQLARFPRGTLTAGHDAVKQISKLIEEHGREIYLESETEASTKFRQLTSDPDVRELRQFVRSYPNSSVISEARRLLAQNYQRQGKYSEAFSVLEENRRNAFDEKNTVDATLAMIEFLEVIHARGSVIQKWQTLSASDRTMQVSFKGKASSLGDAINTEVSTIDPHSPTLPALIERTWTFPLTDDVRVFFPKPDPTEKIASVLICLKDDQFPDSWVCRCLDWRTGLVRWESAASSPILVAGSTPVHLMIGTSQGWEARDTESGRLVWEQIGLTGSTPLLVCQPAGFGEERLWPAAFDEVQGLRLFDPNDGQFVATIKPMGRLHRIIGFVSVSRDMDSVGRPMNGNDPNIVDKERNSSNRKSRQSPGVLMQSVGPTRTWLATAQTPRDEWKIDEIYSEGELWRVPPIATENRVVALGENHRLVSFGISNYGSGNPISETSDAERPSTSIADVDSYSGRIKSLSRSIKDSAKAGFFQQPIDFEGTKKKHRGRGSDEWSNGNLSVAQALPFAWVQQGKLLVLVDGSLLTSFNPSTGIRKWAAGLADFPLQMPSRQLCHDGDLVFGTSRGILRGISIKDGRISIEQYLGSTTPNWRTAVAWSVNQFSSTKLNSTSTNTAKPSSALLAAWPLKTADSPCRTVFLINLESGEIVQRLRVEDEPRELVFDRDGYGILWTRTSLSGLQSSKN